MQGLDIHLQRLFYHEFPISVFPTLPLQQHFKLNKITFMNENLLNLLLFLYAILIPDHLICNFFMSLPNIISVHHYLSFETLIIISMARQNLLLQIAPDVPDVMVLFEHLILDSLICLPWSNGHLPTRVGSSIVAALQTFLFVLLHLLLEKASDEHSVLRFF